MDQMERFLPNLSHLKYLTLHIKGSVDLADGYRWQNLSKNFNIFSFKFKVNIENIEQMLNTFRTSFWLEEKCWYVAYDLLYLFSVPQYGPKHVFNDYNPQYFTVPNQTFLYRNTTEVIIRRFAFSNIHIFDHVEALHFLYNNSQNRPLTILNTQQRQDFEPNWLNCIQLLPFDLRKMPRRYKLSFTVDLTQNFIDQFRGKRYENIRSLEIFTSTKITRFIIEDILHIFPHVECLQISKINSISDMIRLIDGFKYLSNASFTIKSKFTENERNWFQNPELSIRRVRRLSNTNFTCRFYREFRHASSCTVHVWINRQTSQSFWIAHWPPRCGRRYHELMRLVSRHSDVTCSQDDDDAQISDDDTRDYDHTFFDLSPIPTLYQNEAAAIDSFRTCFTKRYNSCPQFFAGSLQAACETAFTSSAIENSLPVLVYIHHDKNMFSDMICSKIFCSEIIIEYLLENYIVWPWDITVESNRNRLIEVWEEMFPTHGSCSFSMEQCPMFIGIMRRSARNKHWSKSSEYEFTSLIKDNVLIGADVKTAREILLHELMDFKEKHDENEQTLVS
ncbi:unnamed protein product [Adineta steineri]|uniref:UAS domain-containing protein n=1 Tax=Adineta steineri TaxID=433720 RepID=A0A814PF16_9BILA|nr:unnamed protein product [Adineta steineri]CAF1103829.1 unnamed protein product [Adineta steineri]